MTPHRIVDGYCFDCNGGCLVGFGNPQERCPVDGCDELPEDHYHPACNDPRHDEIESWYRQVLAARSIPAEALAPDDVRTRWHMESLIRYAVEVWGPESDVDPEADNASMQADLETFLAGMPTTKAAIPSATGASAASGPAHPSPV